MMVHGDDFVAVGSKADLAHTKKTVETKYKLQTETLGTGEGCKQEIRVLNKVLRCAAKELEIEADPRHAE